MIINGMNWYLDNPKATPVLSIIYECYGLSTENNDDAKSLIEAIKKNKVSITPITLDLTSYEDINILKSKELKSQGIFFNGQIFDAYTFISNLLRTAKKEIILIDNYIDDTTFTFFSSFPSSPMGMYTKAKTINIFIPNQEIGNE